MSLLFSHPFDGGANLFKELHVGETTFIAGTQSKLKNRALCILIAFEKLSNGTANLYGSDDVRPFLFLSQISEEKL